MMVETWTSNAAHDVGDNEAEEQRMNGREMLAVDQKRKVVKYRVRWGSRDDGEMVNW